MSTPSRYPAALIESAVTSYSHGDRVKDIAADHGVSPETVRVWARKAGVDRQGVGYHGRCGACNAARALPNGLCRPCADEIPLRGGRWVPRGGIVVWQSEGVAS